MPLVIGAEPVPAAAGADSSLEEAATAAETVGSTQAVTPTPLCTLLFCVCKAPAIGPPSSDMIINVDTPTDETIDPNMTAANFII